MQMLKNTQLQKDLGHGFMVAIKTADLLPVTVGLHSNMDTSKRLAVFVEFRKSAGLHDVQVIRVDFDNSIVLGHFFSSMNVDANVVTSWSLATVPQWLARLPGKIRQL